MRILGEACLLICFVLSGSSAFLSLLSGQDSGSIRRNVAAAAGVVSFASLSITLVILAAALLWRDFSFQYVANYSSQQLPWQYRISALWVGQAGSLLVWTWMMAGLGLALRYLPTVDSVLRDTGYGLVMGNVCFLGAVMLFAADPMAAGLTVPTEGVGLSPLLQHPSMLIHPPIVFLAYAAWSVPCALALAALGRNRVDGAWIRMSRPWALFAWILLGVGLLLGAQWAYQELGWGGYWGWDPVENGSLLPWLTGTAFIHSMMAWRHRGVLRKTALLLGVVTFALCNFATFLTRSGIFSSVHAFSESPVGWMFLALMSLLLVGGVVLVMRQRDKLVPDQPIDCILAREALVLCSTFLLVSLAIVVVVGTLVAPLTKMFLGRMIQVGPEFYNNVLPPVGIGLLAMTSVVPLLQWGAVPTPARRRLLAQCLALSAAAVTLSAIAGLRQPVLLIVVGMAFLTLATIFAAWLLEARRCDSQQLWRGLFRSLRAGRRKYAAYCIHLGFVAVAIGVAGSSLGTQRKDVTLDEGEKLDWAGRQIRYVRLEQRELPDKLVADAVLQVSRGGASPVELRPARHLHLLQNEWTTEVAIDSSWRGDFYTVLHAGLGDGRVVLTFVDNPMIGWIWGGGILVTCAAIVALWPPSRRAHIAVVANGSACVQITKHHHPRARRAA